MRQDRFRTEASEAIPDGYARLRGGQLRPDDLLWSIFEKKFRRQDDPEWKHRPDRAEVVVCAVRWVGMQTKKSEPVRKLGVPTVQDDQIKDPFLFAMA